MIDRATKSLEKFLPKSVIDEITAISKEQEEHEKLVSFQTRVDYLAEFFNQEQENLA